MTRNEKTVRVQKFIQLADVLSDNDKELHHAIELFVNNNLVEFEEIYTDILVDFNLEHGLDNGTLDIEDVVKYGLIGFGYMGYNDWKFPLEDFLFNSEKAFQHYNIDMSVYHHIPNQDEIYAPEAFEIIAEHLPNDFGLGMWDFNQDSYVLIMSTKTILDTASILAKDIGVTIYPHLN